MFSTSDVYLASALLSLKYELVNIDRTNPKHMIFEFQDRDRTPLQEMRLSTEDGKVCLSDDFINDVEKMWANRTLAGNLNDFSEAIKRMKSLIHSS